MLHQISSKKKILVAGDILAVFIAFLIAASIKVALTQPYEIWSVFKKFDYPVVLYVLLYPISFYVFELYDEKRCRTNVILLVFLSSATISATIVLAFISYLFTANIIIGRVILFSHMIVTVLLAFLWRKSFLKFVSKNGRQKILLLGCGPIIDEIKEYLKKDVEYPPMAVDIIKEYSENPRIVTINGSATGKKFLDFVTASGYDTVIVADSLKKFPILRKHLFDLRFSGVKIYDALYYYKNIKGKVPISHVEDTWFVFHNQGEAFNSFGYRRVKKIVDVMVALTGLVISAPLMILISAAVKISSKGPVFFKQARVGQNGREFSLIKFRTMIDNAEANTGPIWARKNDSRITTVGKFLRKARIDEVPQLFNVLKGDMSLMGPRPIRKYFEDECYENILFYKLRHIVKPGVTGWAQVQNFDVRAESGPMERLEYDLYYIQNQSILFDLFIVLKTVQTVLFRRGQ